MVSSAFSLAKEGSNLIKATLSWLAALAAALMLATASPALAADNTQSLDSNATVRVIDDTIEEPDPGEEDKEPEEGAVVDPTDKEPGDPTPEPVDHPTKNENEALPQAGSHSSVVLIAAGLMVLGAIAAASLTTRNRKKG